MKKFFCFLTLLLVFSMAIILVACNPNGNGEGIQLSSDMTLEQVKEALKDATNFSIQTCAADGYVEYTWKYGRDWYSVLYAEQQGGSASFIEDNKYYAMDVYYNYPEIAIYDISGYDVGEDEDIQPYLEYFYEQMGNRGFTIKDNAINVAIKNDNGEVVGWDIAKDFNTTTIDIPEIYKNTYKTLAPNSSVLEYESLTPETCKLTKINLTLKSLQIPETYDGKIVTEVELNFRSKKVSVPKTVQYITGIYADTEIIYAGTKADWMKMKSSNGTITGNVHCTDGDFANGSWYFHPDMDDNTVFNNLLILWDVDDNWGIDNFTAVVDGGEEYGITQYKFSNYGESGKSEDSSDWHVQFFEDNTAYIMGGSAGETRMQIIDLTGYNYDSDLFKKSKRSYLESIISIMKSDGYSIVDGTIVIPTENGTITLKDFCETELDIPEKYADYKKLKVNTENAVYQLKGDGYALSDIIVPLKEYTVPDTYNGKPVVAIESVWTNIQDKMIIPKSVTSVGSIADSSSRPSIEYLGTQVQWARVQKGSGWNEVGVNCTGTVDESGARLRSDMSVEELKNVLATVKNYTMSQYDGENYIIYKCTEDGDSERAAFDNKNWNFKKYDRNRCYEFANSDGELMTNVYDLTNYDFDDTYMQKEIALLWEELTYIIENSMWRYMIENDMILIRDDADSVIVIYGFDSTELDIPEEYEDYKRFVPNCEVEEYVELSDTECELNRLDVPMKTYVVAESYNGRTVTSIGRDVFQFVEKIVIPTTVSSIDKNYNEDFTVEYQGTIEEWENIEKTGYWTNVKVVCSDGTING